jgi:signal transduction histidine kinase
MNKNTKRMKVPFITSVEPGSEAERQRLSRELHDLIGQPLTILKLMTERAMTSPVTNRQLLEEIRALLVDTLSDVRKLCLSLQPYLENPDLRGALDSLIERSSKQNQVHLKFQHSGLPESIAIPAAVTQAIIVIVQEALTNVCSHAGVNGGTVKIWSTSKEMRVMIDDKGIGFDPHKLTGTRFGLASMQEAANLVSGSLTIESAPGAGTRVTARFPLSGRRRKESRKSE